MDMATLIRSMAGEASRENAYAYDISKATADITQLKVRMDSYDSERDYDVGDLIEWKPGLKDCGNKFPSYGQPVYCVEVSSMREPMERDGRGTCIDFDDLAFCIYHEDADAVSFFTGDSKRFRKYRKPSE